MKNRVTSPGFEAVLLIDWSGSMGKKDRISAIATADFLFQTFDLIGIEKTAYTYTYSGGLSLINTKTREGLQHILNQHRSGGSTPTGEALYWILKEVEKRKSLPIVFLITDGDPNDSQVVAQALEYAEKKNFYVFCNLVETGNDSLDEALKNSDSMSYKEAINTTFEQTLSDGTKDQYKLFPAEYSVGAFIRLWNDYNFVLTNSFKTKTIADWIIQKVAIILKQKRR